MQNSVLERRNQLKRIIYASAILLLLTTIYLSVNFFDKWTLHQRDNQGSESMNYILSANMIIFLKKTNIQSVRVL